MNVLFTLIYALLSVFVVSSFVGLLQARRDIRKNKNEDNELRKSRKEVISEKCNPDFNFNSGSDILSVVNNLSPQEQELFKSELRKKFNEGSAK